MKRNVWKAAYLKLETPASASGAETVSHDSARGTFITWASRRRTRMWRSPKLIKSGSNTIQIEPFSPKSAKLVVY